MGKLKRALNSFQLIELATKQGYKNNELNTSGAITNILTKKVSKGVFFEICVSVLQTHEFTFFIENFGRITIFDNLVDFENLSIIENKLLKIYNNEIKTI